MSTQLRDDEISKRIFYAGCLGLPWLWIVHTLGWYDKQRGEDQGLLDEDNAPESGDVTPAEVSHNERQWVRRCRNSAFVVSFAWLVWIMLVQVLLTEAFPSSWFVREPDQGEYTGW